MTMQPPTPINLPTPTSTAVVNNPNAPVPFVAPAPLSTPAISGVVTFHQGAGQSVVPPEQFGWTIPSITTEPRIIMSVRGLEKMGKDFFGLTSCLCGYGPVYLHNFDFGTEGVSDKFLRRGGTVYEKVYRLPKMFNMLPQALKIEMAEAIHAEFIKFWNDSLNRGKGTIIVDTHSEEWEIRRLAKFGKLTQIMPTQYTEVNNEFRGEIRDAYEAGMNVILLQKQKDQYIQNTKTGKQEPAGFGDVGYLVQANLEAYRNQQDGHFNIWVHDNRLNMAMSGQAIDVHDRWDAFGMFMNMTFGNDLAPLQPALGGNGPAAVIPAPVLVSAPTPAFQLPTGFAFPTQ